MIIVKILIALICAYALMEVLKFFVYFLIALWIYK